MTDLTVGKHLAALRDDKPRIHLGVPIGPFEGRIDGDAARAFALATNDPNPAYFDGRAIPPLYSVALILPALEEGLRCSIDEGAIVNKTHGVHGEHDVYFHAPMRADSTVQWTVSTSSAHVTPAGVLVTQRIMVSDMVGDPLVEHFWSTLYVGGSSSSLGGPELADHRYPEAARDRVVGSEAIEIAFDQAFRYAGVSRDHAPHCLDDEVARSEGFPSKILQGMCTLAMCSGALVRLVADGDPNSLRRLATRFSSPVPPSHPLIVEAVDAGVAANGNRTFAFEARSEGVVRLNHGRVEIGMPAS